MAKAGRLQRSPSCAGKSYQTATQPNPSCSNTRVGSSSADPGYRRNFRFAPSIWRAPDSAVELSYISIALTPSRKNCHVRNYIHCHTAVHTHQRKTLREPCSFMIIGNIYWVNIACLVTTPKQAQSEKSRLNERVYLTIAQAHT